MSVCTLFALTKFLDIVSIDGAMCTRNHNPFTINFNFPIQRCQHGSLQMFGHHVRSSVAFRDGWRILTRLTAGVTHRALPAHRSLEEDIGVGNEVPIDWALVA